MAAKTTGFSDGGSVTDEFPKTLLVAAVGVFFLCRQGLVLGSFYLVHHFAYRAYRIISIDLINRIVFSQRFFRGDIKQSEVIKALVNDMVMVSNAGFKNMLNMCADLIVMLVLFGFVFVFYGYIVAGFVGLVLMLAIVPLIFFHKILKHFALKRHHLDFERQENLTTLLLGALPISVQDKKKSMLERTDKNLIQYCGLEVWFGVMNSFPKIFIEFLFLVIICMVLMVSASGLDVTDLISNGLVILILISRFAPIFQRMMLAFIQFRVAEPAIDHISSLVYSLDARPVDIGRPKILTSPTNLEAKCKQGSVKFTFSTGVINYIIGKSGTGKSTFLMKLIGIIPIEDCNEIVISSAKEMFSGSVLAAGQKVGFVGQNGNIVSGTLRENFLLTDPKMLDRDIWDILERFNLAQRFLSSNDGLDTYLADNGKKLSGGERQRLDLSLALCGDADILILDEPFSGLDNSIKSKILKLIRQISDNIMVIIVTHDVASIKPTDNCVNFDIDGHILKHF